MVDVAACIVLVSTTSSKLFENRCDDGKEGEGQDRGEEEDSCDDDDECDRIEEKEGSASCEACEKEDAYCEEEAEDSIVFLNTTSALFFIFTSSSITMSKLSEAV